MDEKRLLELKELNKHKRNKHKVGSKHYWRYSGKIEAINDIIQLNKDRAISEQR